MRITDTEIVSVSAETITVAFSVEDDQGNVVDAPAAVSVDGDRRCQVDGSETLRLVTIDQLQPSTEYAISIEVAGAEAAERDSFFPDTVRTLAAPSAPAVATIGTLNDLHFGEKRLGAIPGVINESIDSDEGPVPYWQFMNDDAIADMNAAGLDAVFIKGDITDRGKPGEFADAAAAFGKIASPWHAILGNHDYYALNDSSEEVDGYGLLGQEPAPKVVDLDGWRVVLVDSVEPGNHRGRILPDQIQWLDETLATAARDGCPVMLMMHHQPVPPAFASGVINKIGIPPEHSVPLFDCVANHESVKGVLIGHTHRNRVRRYLGARNIPFAEVNCTKDYPGGWAKYRLDEDGSFRQEVQRTSSARAREHSRRCGKMAEGRYRRFAIGTLDDRCFVA